MEITVPEYKILPEVKLDPRATALVVGDMQVDFVSPKGRLFVPEARKTIPKILHLISKARRANSPIFFVQDWHRSDDPEFSLWPPHTVAGTPGAKVVSQLKPMSVDFFIHKKTYELQKTQRLRPHLLPDHHVRDAFHHLGHDHHQHQ